MGERSRCALSSDIYIAGDVPYIKGVKNRSKVEWLEYSPPQYHDTHHTQDREDSSRDRVERESREQRERRKNDVEIEFLMRSNMSKSSLLMR